jgi:hypothetical protein
MTMAEQEQEASAPAAPDEAAQEGRSDDDEHVVEQQPVQPESVQPTSLVRQTRPADEVLIAGTDLPVVPRENEMHHLAQLAVTLSAAAAVPAALRGKPNDVFLVLLTARDTGVALTTAMREFHVIEGKVTLSPKVKLAMVRQQGIGNVYPHQAPRMVMVDGEQREQLCRCGKRDGENDATRATWHGERNDEPGILHSSTFTIEDAARVPAKEGGSTITLDQKHNWKAYPQRMLSWRACGYLLDDVFGEVGTGLYSPDEMGAQTDEQGEPIIDVIGHADPVPGTSAPRGHNRPPAEPPAEATDEQRAALKARIDSLPANGRAALVAMWTEGKDTDAGPRLPPLRALLAKQLSKADALVSSFESRARKGEWGEWEPPAAGAADSPPEGPESPPDAPESDAASESTSNDESAQSAPEQPAGDEPVQGTLSDPPGPEGGDVADVVQTIIDDVATLSDHDVREELGQRGKSRNGTDAQVRRRLAMYRAKDAGVKVTDAEIKQATQEGDE